jgi:microcystin-dependent protein
MATKIANIRGPTGLNAFNITSAGFVVPPVGSTVNVTVNDASWIVVGQFVYIDQAGGGAGQPGIMQVTAKSGNLVTLLNPTAAPTVPPADSTQNGLLRQVSGLTTDFIDGTNHSKALTSIAPADATKPGLLRQLSGLTTDFVDGSNNCQNLVAALAALLVPPASVLDYAGAAAPTGFLLCDGSAVSRTTYSGLYSALGGASSPWGQGDGSTTFNVPDLRGVATIGAGQGTGLTNRVLAATGGSETQALATANLPAHSHTATSTQGTHTHTDSGHQHGVAGGNAGSYGVLSTSPSAAGAYLSLVGNAQISTVSAGAITTTIGNTGSGTAHNNMQPFAVCTKIIKT